MSLNECAQHLHDKAIRGCALSTEEQAQLDAWYAEQDAREGAALAPAGASPRLAALHTQVETVLAQLLIVTQRIQALTASNDTLRCEITALQRRLPLAATREPA